MMPFRYRIFAFIVPKMPNIQLTNASNITRYRVTNYFFSITIIVLIFAKCLSRYGSAQRKNQNDWFTSSAPFLSASIVDEQSFGIFKKKTCSLFIALAVDMVSHIYADTQGERRRVNGKQQQQKIINKTWM